jgi:hypothetical protein
MLTMGAFCVGNASSMIKIGAAVMLKPSPNPIMPRAAMNMPSTNVNVKLYRATQLKLTVLSTTLQPGT